MGGGIDDYGTVIIETIQFLRDSRCLDRMLKAIFPFAFSLTPQETLNRTLNQLQLNTKEPLPQDYYNLIFANPNTLSQTFSALVAQLPNASSAAAIIKTFTIILQVLRNNHYSIEILAVLESIEMPCFARVEQCDCSWITEITIAVKSYLVRLPSIVDVFERMAAYKQSKSERSHSFNLPDLYRILNVFGLLFPAVTNCLNIIGRYYAKTYLYFPQFYKTIKQEILQGYEFLQHLVSNFKNSYKQYDSCELQCFMQTVSAIELYCDRVEEFTMNKYFKGKGPNKKIYFREQELQEISYYLHQLKTAKEQFNHTKDEEQDFGAFQQ